ncbi:MAG: glutamate--tRNA ligase, partial [Dehalococcoidia bacterium]|nr:glutamate--tRNA ligase [Dehalococcoidia bacterium]
MAENVRVRYAPSPTGEPHIGNVRTALFNWLFARHHGGKFIVRVEDTDQERLVPGAVDAVLDSLEWLNIQWDEGPRVGGPYAPYVQSERLSIYQDLAGKLVDQGRAYRCYCSREKLEQMRRERREQGFATSHACQCREMTERQRSDAEAATGPPVVRFGMPTEGVTRVHDLIRGDVEWQNDLQEDFIILKSDGFPTYHLAVVADDHFMEISHIMRAEEWLPSTPRHLQLFDALGFEPPQFAHLPMILGPDRSKLSKRHGATAVSEYRDKGFLPGALINFMVLLGWSLDDKTEVMSLDMIKDNFTLDRVTKSAAIFDQEKLEWMSGVYIREMSSKELAGNMLPFLERDLPKELLPVDRDYLDTIAPLIQERIKLMETAADSTLYFFEEQPEYDPSNLI